MIDAQIEWDDIERGWYMRTNEPVDVYSTGEPQHQFDARIKFCLQLHNSVTRALRYPTRDNKDKQSADEQREREALELQLAEELAEEDDDDF